MTLVRFDPNFKSAVGFSEEDIKAAEFPQVGSGICLRGGARLNSRMSSARTSVNLDISQAQIAVNLDNTAVSVDIKFPAREIPGELFS